MSVQIKKASTVQRHSKPSFLMLGKTGSGKTTQFLTLPGKKLIYLFDPNAMATLAGHEVDYLEFLPSRIPLQVTSLNKNVNERNSRKVQETIGRLGKELYDSFEEHLEEMLSSGGFDQYDAIGFDSCTTLLEMIMDAILYLNGRPGQWPGQDDWGPQMLTFTKIVRQMTSIGKAVYFTAHLQQTQDEVTKSVSNQPLLTGQLKTKIPLLFSEILVAEAGADSRGNVSYTVQTRQDRRNDICRTSLRDVQFKENVTLDFADPLEQQGLGKLYRGSISSPKSNVAEGR